jgi:hypothetical protein
MKAYPIYYKAKLKGWDEMSQEERLEVREELHRRRLFGRQDC